MPRFVGAVSGLLLFAAMILRGLMIGNPVAVVLSRALVGLFLGLLLGVLVGWVAQRVIEEHVAAGDADAAPAGANAADRPAADGAPPAP